MPVCGTCKVSCHHTSSSVVLGHFDAGKMNVWVISNGHLIEIVVLLLNIPIIRRRFALYRSQGETAFTLDPFNFSAPNNVITARCNGEILSETNVRNRQYAAGEL